MDTTGKKKNPCHWISRTSGRDFNKEKEKLC